MNIENLDIVKELISEKENGQVEFKETTGQLETRNGNSLRLSERERRNSHVWCNGQGKDYRSGCE